jgi:hypothetical protein
MFETYICKSHTTLFGWSDGSVQDLFAPILRGQRIIIINTGGGEGFVPNSYVHFKSHQRRGDYHNDLNFRNYKKWVKEKLILSPPPNSVIVTDSAPYRNVQVNPALTSNSRKSALISRFKKKGIPHAEGTSKPNLYQFI